MQPIATSGALAEVNLLWIPLGADAYVVRWTGRVYEAIVALRERRPRRDLYHSALVVAVAGERWAIESAPVPDPRGEDRGVVGTGPVGIVAAGRFRPFRYEIRCWRGGSIPDAVHAVESPVRLSNDTTTAKRVLDLVPAVPTPVWGRDTFRTGEMWNSNSLTAWVLERAGFDTDVIALPARGRAPGWSAGVAVARAGRG